MQKKRAIKIQRTKKLQTYIRETQKQLKEINYQRSDLIFRIKELQAKLPYLQKAYCIQKNHL